MSDEEPNQQSSGDSQPPEEKPVDSEQSSAESEATDQSGEQSEEQPVASDEHATKDQTTEQGEEQSTDANQTAERPQEQPDAGDQASTSASATDTVASAGEDATPIVNGGASTAEPAKAGSPPVARKRLFRFVVYRDLKGLMNLAPDSLRTAAVSLTDITGYAFGFGIVGAADAGPVHMIEDSWERVPVDGGAMDFPFSTVERSSFFITLALIPNSNVDPKAPTSEPLERISSISTKDFAPMKASDAAPLVKDFPDGVFILAINLLAFYSPIPVTGSTTFEAELARVLKIRPEDVFYNVSSPAIDNSGKAIGTNHDVGYWATDLRLDGRKYVP